MRRPKISDTSGAELSGSALLTGTLALRRLLRREVLKPEEQYVGVLLPPSLGSVLSNTALTMDRRIAVNLNYTVSPDVMNSCIAQCGIRHVLTSPRVMERLNMKIDAELIFVEDLRKRMTRADKLIAAAQAWTVPVAVLERQLGLTEIRPDDVLTVMFTSGSTGQPKGVMLTHGNVGSNVEGIQQIVHLTERDVLMGVLPIFHSFGYTVTMWTVLALDPKGVYHYTPLEARQIGKLCHKHRATILVATPTFLRSYLRRCEPEDLKSLDVVFVGAEKLPVELAAAFEKQFGVHPVEGYGATELSPVVSGNIPPSRAASGSRQGAREGSIGRPLPGIEAKVIDLDTGEDLGVDQPGMLLVRGPNVMKGYLGRPDLTAEVMRDGWYVTGDVARIDRDGFVFITGRINRFSKIGGEMVPHIRIEEAINQICGFDEDEVHVAVTAVPDEKKGERLVVLHTGLPRAPEELCRALIEKGLPPIWVPSADSFRQVETVPVLGTGKLDLKRVKELAMEAITARV
jgi:acyl-[acyl-carrier-protein]-phospholipid O-acyltransferase/long-chain-fatty-acid--[acyl-carrier-protein] ligase